jgi:hypothetical protein
MHQSRQDVQSFLTVDWFMALHFTSDQCTTACEAHMNFPMTKYASWLVTLGMKGSN